MSHATGYVLSRPQLLKEGKSLLNGFDEAQVRGAGYDLRVGNHLRDSAGELRKLDDGSVYSLKPGEGAIVITKECLQLGKDTAANVTLKTGIARTGILLLSGMLVDPGWDRELHLTILNIGSEDFVIYPGRPLAGLQLVRLPVADNGPGATSDVADNFFSTDAPIRKPVAFLDKVNVLGTKFETISSSHDELRKESEKLGVLAGQVIPLAILLVAATVFGVMTDISISLLSNRKTVGALSNLTPHTARGTIITIALIVFGIVVVASAWMVPGRRLVSQASVPPH